MLALEDELENIEDPFLAQAMTLAIDGIRPPQVAMAFALGLDAFV